MNMNRTIGWFVGNLLIVVSVGCGSGSTPVGQSGGDGSTNSPNGAQASAPDPSPAMEVVSQFLDALRRGGSDGESLDLVTTKAREEFRRTGLVLQPIGSPDATFTVNRCKAVPGDENAALVHSTWIEPSEDGESQPMEVVWAVQNEAQQWRISGMVISLPEGQNPIVVDFENGSDLAAKFPAPAPAQNSVLHTATAPSENAGLPLETPTSLMR